MTKNEKAIADLFGILCAIVSSEGTPYATKQATISTFADLISKEGSVFQDEELIDMTLAMDQSMKRLVDQLNGNNIINNVLTNNINLN
jgi:hypothetical protein